MDNTNIEKEFERTEKRIDSNKGEIKYLQEKLIKTDNEAVKTTERYNSLVDLYKDIQTDVKEILLELKGITTNLAVNDITTKNNKNILDQFTVPKILAIGVTVLIIISYWKA